MVEDAAGDRFGKFYFSHEACDALVAGSCQRFRIDVHRVAVSLSSSPVEVAIDQDKVFSVRAEASDASLLMPGLLVETNGAVIVWYQSFPVDGSAQKIRYNVLYENEPKFRDSALLRASGKTNPGIIYDTQLGGAVEPGSLGFWITNGYTDAAGTAFQAVGRIAPGCGTLALCGSSCSNLSADRENCGACGHACGAKEACTAGVCKPTKTESCQPPFKLLKGDCCMPCYCKGQTLNICHDAEACTHACWE